MNRDRTYSTREIAQMWNVSETTVKRWADAGLLKCFRTPGGHRKFKLDDISEFQASRGFQATGMLTNQDWEDPDVENFVNQKNRDKLRDLTLYLAVQNQVKRIRELLDRLYIRGLELADLYDNLLLPVAQSLEEQWRNKTLSLGQHNLGCNNLESAIAYFYPRIISRRPNGKTALCASPDPEACVLTEAVGRILESEGWDCLNLGPRTPFTAMAEMVKEEPINLVCICSVRCRLDSSTRSEFDALCATAETYRIPIVLTGSVFAKPELRDSLPSHEYFSSLSSLRQYVKLSAR